MRFLSGFIRRMGWLAAVVVVCADARELPDLETYSRVQGELKVESQAEPSWERQTVEPAAPTVAQFAVPRVVGPMQFTTRGAASASSAGSAVSSGPARKDANELPMRSPSEMAVVQVTAGGPVPANESVQAGLAPVVSVDTKTWALRMSDERVEMALRRWSGAVGVNLLWDADRHFMVEAPTDFLGSFEAAVQALLSSPAIASSTYPLEACLYANVPPVLRVTRLGDHTPDCKAKP